MPRRVLLFSLLDLTLRIIKLTCTVLKLALSPNSDPDIPAHGSAEQS